MSKADDMFKELGYCLIHCEDGFFYYNSINNNAIHFDKVKERITCYDYDTCLANAIELVELQAINEKCKELGWIE